MGTAVSDIGTIIIVGGGVAGLYSAVELLKHGYHVTILEANQRLGGRIHTIRDPSFDHPVERGFEFIHGNLPVTIQLLKEANIPFNPVKGEMIRIVKGDWKTQDDFTVGWKELMEHLNELRDDMTVNQFLEKNFSDDKYAALRKSVVRFAEGFDLADPSDASVLALREEWMGEEDEQYRVSGGCDQIINYLENQCRNAGGSIHTSSVVSKIEWQKNSVKVSTADQNEYTAATIIITVSLAILSATPPLITFQPAINNYIEATGKIGFGRVIKILLQFKEPFWRERKKNIGFIFSDEVIPTWWTQLPSPYPLLTGWAGGPQARGLEEKDDRPLLALALQSLANIFKKPVDELKDLLSASSVTNWKKVSFIQGGYSYSKVGSTQAQKFLNTPIEDSIFFAGEAYYDGPSPGTVEAALVSAKNVVEKIFSAK